MFKSTIAIRKNLVKTYRQTEYKVSLILHKNIDPALKLKVCESCRVLGNKPNHSLFISYRWRRRVIPDLQRAQIAKVNTCKLLHRVRAQLQGGHLVLPELEQAKMRVPYFVGM